MDTGDRVRVRVDLGGFFRPRVRRGTAGIVVALVADGRLAVRFADGLVEFVSPEQVEPM